MEEKETRQEERTTAATGQDKGTAPENRETDVNPKGKEKQQKKKEPEKPLTPK